MTHKMKTNVAFLPIESIVIALNITKDKLLSLDVTPEMINEKPYYSLDNLDELRQIIQNS